MKHFNILEIIKENLLNYFTSYDVRYSYDGADANSVYIKPCIVLDSAYEEKDGSKVLRIKAAICVSKDGDLFKRDAIEVFEFITSLVKANFPAVLSVYLSDVQNMVTGKFKKRTLEITVVPPDKKECYIGGTPVYITDLVLYRETDSKPIWQMCSKDAVAYIDKKHYLVGVIKNCRISKDLLSGEFDIEYENKLLKRCTLIYAKGDEYISEAKFYIGSIE